MADLVLVRWSDHLYSLLTHEELILDAVALVIVYIGSYAWFRSSHVQRWDRDGRDYVIFPQQPALYYLYRPLTYFDARLTGMRFHMGPHRS